MPRIRDQRERVSEQTENNFYENESRVERNADRKRPAEIRRRVTVPESMRMTVMMAIRIAVISVTMPVVGLIM